MEFASPGSSTLSIWNRCRLNALVLVKLKPCVWKRAVKILFVRRSSVIQLVPPLLEPSSRHADGSRSDESLAEVTVYCVTTARIALGHCDWIQLARVAGLFDAKSSHFVARSLSKALVASSVAPSKLFSPCAETMSLRNSVRSNGVRPGWPPLAWEVNCTDCPGITLVKSAATVTANFGTTEMLSNMEEFNTVFSCAVTASPTSIWPGMALLTLPTKVQLVPSGETAPVKIFPVRTRRTQYGAITFGPVVLAVAPSVTVRRTNADPLPGVMAMSACFDPAARLSRNITPAFAHGSVFSTAATRATICPSLVNA